MKKCIIIALCVIIAASCAKKTNPVTPTPSAPNPVTPTNARFIPNWQRDTLVAYFVDIQGDVIYDSTTWEPVRDTIISYSINDTSFIENNKKRYYLWWEPLSGIDTFINNHIAYYNCVISTTKDTTGEIASGVGVRPYRSWDNFYNDWRYVRQDLWGYTFNKKYKLSPLGYTSIKK